MKKQITWISLIIVIALLLSSCQNSNTDKLEEQRLASESEELAQMNILISTNNIPNSIIMKSEDLDKLSYSIEFQDKYINRYIVFIGWIDDIKRVDDKIYLISSDWINDIYYTLALSSEQYDKLVEIRKRNDIDNKNWFEEFTILAQITNVSKSRATLNANGSDEEGFNFDIDLPGELIFYGKCVDFALYQSDG
jgi:hypothetical protein